MEENELEGRLAQVNADLSTERDARLTATREKDEAMSKVSELESQLQSARAALLRLTQENQSLFADVQTAGAENEKLRTDKAGLETQWAEREVPPDNDLRQEIIDQRVTIDDLQSRISELMNAEEEINDNLEAEANDALKDALEMARHEAALAKQEVETLTGQTRVLEADFKASKDESDSQFRELQQQAMARSNRLEGLNAETEGKLVMTQKELTKVHSQLEKLELQLRNMSADHYARVTEDAEQLRELRSELRKQPSPAHAAFRSQMLSKFLGIYLLLIKPAQWTTILESLDDEQVPGQGMEPWTFVSSIKSLDEPLPTVEATCLAILAAAPESREYLPLAARLCSLLSAYTQAPRTLVDMALRTITGSVLIGTSGELLFFATAAARLAGLEKDMWPSILPLMAGNTIPALQSLVGLAMRKSINGVELRALFSSQGAVCQQPSVGFMEGVSCVLVEFPRRTLHVVKHESFVRRSNEGLVVNTVQTMDKREVVFVTNRDATLRLMRNMK